MTILLIALMTLNTAAAEDKIEPKVVYKKETTIDFEGIDVEGQLVRPNGALLTERSKAAFNPLIHLRTDFNLEMSNSINDIK